MKRNLFTIDVKIRLQTGRQRHLAFGKGQLAQQRKQAIMVVCEVGLLPQLRDRFRVTHALMTTTFSTVLRVIKHSSLAAFCIVWAALGLFGHDPWKPDEDADPTW